MSTEPETRRLVEASHLAAKLQGVLRHEKIDITQAALAFGLLLGWAAPGAPIEALLGYVHAAMDAERAGTFFEEIPLH